MTWGAGGLPGADVDGGAIPPREGDKGETVPWDSYYEIARSEYDTVTIEMRRAAKPSEAEEEGDNYP